MRALWVSVVLAGVLSVAGSAAADETFSSRRTRETEVSVYRRGSFPAYGHRFVPGGSSTAYAGARPYAARRATTGLRRQRRTLSRGRPYRGWYGPGGEWEFTYSRRVNVEEEVTWTGEIPYGFTTWQSYTYPGNTYYGLYGLPYSAGPYRYYSYRRPIGHRFLSERFPGGYYRSYYYPYGGTAIDIRLRW